MGKDASKNVGGASWILYCARVPSAVCAFHVQNVQRPQFVQGEE